MARRKRKDEPWLVQATFNENRSPGMAEKLKKLVRKPVSGDGGCGKWMTDIDWSYATERGARAAALRLRLPGVKLRVYDLRGV